jgi:hypothetical protein
MTFAPNSRICLPDAEDAGAGHQTTTNPGVVEHWRVQARRWVSVPAVAAATVSSATVAAAPVAATVAAA